MIVTSIERDEIWEDAGATCMARITGGDGSNITQSDVSSISRKVFDRNSTAPDVAVGSTTLTVANVVFDTLQTDSRWSKDATGFNFADVVGSTMFPTGGHRYRIEYGFAPDSGQPYKAVFEVLAKEVLGS